MAEGSTAPSAEPLTGRALAEAMVGLGMRLSGDPNRDADIESVLVSASAEGLDHDNLRALDVLTTWIWVHGSIIAIEDLAQRLRRHSSPRMRSYWASIGHWHELTGRGEALRDLVEKGTREPLLRVGNAFQVSRRGEDEHFRGTPLIVPAGVFRYRRADVDSPVRLASSHRRIRERMGPGAPTGRG